MKYLFVLSLNFVLLTSLSFSQNYSLVIHGGAGNFDSSEFSEDRFNEYYRALEKTIMYGDSLLALGYAAIDVVEGCVIKLENSPLFNAGKGAVLNSKGEYELDASIMEGKTLNAGAVAGVRTVKNPISAARLVMDSSSHILLTAAGADAFAKKYNLKTVPQDYFFEENRYQRYKELKKENKGTVGAVALDLDGNLAAATSTGGMMMKRFGRVGDSPIIGAGTYADNNTVAVSSTGHGEFFIRTLAAFRISALVKYAGLDAQQAAENTINDIETLGGYGGVIVVDKDGNIAMPFNTKSMFRAYINSDNKIEVLF